LRHLRLLRYTCRSPSFSIPAMASSLSSPTIMPAHTGRPPHAIAFPMNLIIGSPRAPRFSMQLVVAHGTAPKRRQKVAARGSACLCPLARPLLTLLTIALRGGMGHSLYPFRLKLMAARDPFETFMPAPAAGRVVQ